MIAVAAEAIHKLSVTAELEDAIVESAECVDEACAINCDSHGQLRITTGAADRFGNRPYQLAVCVEYDNVVAIALPGGYQSTICGHRHVIKAVSLVFQCAKLLPRFAAITIDASALGDIDRAFAIGCKAANQCLSIANAPLRNKLTRRIEDLNSTTGVLGDVDPSGAIDADAARVVEHPWSDPFAPKLEQDIREGVGALLLGSVWSDRPGGFFNCAAYRIKCRTHSAERNEQGNNYTDQGNRKHQQDPL